ncbi:MAG: bifunctional diguanylate cyclase/phosphodiesterase [Kangiellaceae bacterium]|nr:bifunctional diguanylate cyclase/phosphodiesterase [Kangiellaceae bacterium]
MEKNNNDSEVSLILFENPQRRVSNLKKVFLIFIGVFALLIINNVIFIDSYWNPELIAGMTVSISLYFIVTPERAGFAAGVMLWMITILGAYVAWNNDGLYDTAVFVFPVILTFAFLLTGKFVIIPLSLFIVSVFYLLAYAQENQLIAQSLITEKSMWSKANNTTILFSFYGFSIYLTSLYFKRLFSKLYHNQKIRDEMKQRADRLAFYDQTTELPNALQCKQNLESHFLEFNRNDELVALITIAITNINWLNSSFGHEFANKCLKYISDALKTFEHDSARLFRNTGQEFIFLRCATDIAEIKQLAEDCISLFNQPLLIEEFDVIIDLRCGIAITPDDGVTFEQLQQRSYIALSKAIESKDGKKYQLFAPALEDFTKKKLMLLHEVKTAIEHKEFELYYQPKINLTTGDVVGAEALIRWKKPTGQMVFPDQFIPTAEESGLIVDIGEWTIKQACYDCKNWQLSGKSNMHVAVNLSWVQFKRSHIPSIVRLALEETGLSPEYLELEVTESLLIDDLQRVNQQLQELVDMGVNIAIDDFGTGYSNLNYLAQFNASTLKIDRSFVANMVDSTEKRHIVEAILKMSHAMNLINVAEGVENSDSIALLKQLGCEYGQGYFWSKPISNHAFYEKYVKQSTSERMH